MIEKNKDKNEDEIEENNTTKVQNPEILENDKVEEIGTTVEKNKKTEKTFLQMLWSDGKWCLAVFIILMLIFNFILMNGIVPSESMKNTIQPGSFIITNRLAYSNSEPEKGDIVVFKTDTMETAYVKRIIGTENDVIDIKNNKVYLNNKELDESAYVLGYTMIGNNARSHFVVPEGCVFLLGDNRNNSSDARYWNYPFIETKDIIGEVILEYSIGNKENGFFIKNIESQELKIVENNE